MPASKVSSAVLRHRVSTKAEDNRGKLKRARGHENLYVVDFKSFPAICFHSIVCSSRLSVRCGHSFVCGHMVGALCCPPLPRDRNAVTQQPNCTNPRNQHSQLIFLTFPRIICLSCHVVEEGAGLDPLCEGFYP